MEKIRLVLVTKEEAYGQALGMALGEGYPRFSIGVFPGFAEASMDSADLLVTDLLPELPEDFPGKIVYLSDDPIGPSSGSDPGEGPCVLYKYMGVHRLGAELEFLCRDHGVGLPPGLDLAKAAAAGFLGGRGKTSAAIAVANELAFYYGRRVLYLSLEEWPLTELFFLRDPGVRSFGDYLYYLFSDGRREWAASLEPFLLRNVFGVETFAFGSGPNALRSLAFEDLTVLLGDLWGRSRYDWVLLDFGESVTGNFPVLADLCRSLFCLTDGTLPDRVRTDRIRNFLLQSGGEPLADKLVPVRNFWTPEQLLEPDEIPIENDPDSFFIQDGYWCIDPSRGFGMGVRTIAEILEGVGENPGKEVDPVRPVGHQFAGNRGLR